MTDWIYIIAFYGVTGVALLGALGVLFLRNLFHAGLSLILALCAVASLFVLLGAEFLAGVQVLIYVGAIAVLILFAVMLTQRITSRRVKQYTRAILPAVPVVLALGAVSALVMWKVELPPLGAIPDGEGAIEALASALLSTYLLPFEVISLLLLGALIGAIVLARKEERE
jgi:NADH:ubiquinone oxidoreductase subunit 6 (subunit J)